MHDREKPGRRGLFLARIEGKKSQSLTKITGKVLQYLVLRGQQGLCVAERSVLVLCVISILGLHAQTLNTGLSLLGAIRRRVPAHSIYNGM